jgi:lipid-binding SYLF domain-containing protein
VAEAFAALPVKHVPPALLHEARGIAIIPHVVKVGLLVDRCFGRGVFLVREPNGEWSNPICITLQGKGIGLEAGIEAEDLVLIFRSEASVKRLVEGKARFSLGSDVAIAVGPVGREVEETARRAEIYSYSRTRGLFAGVSLEGDRLEVDAPANRDLYHLHEGHPAEVLAIHGGPTIVEVVHLKEHLNRMCKPPAAVPEEHPQPRHR